ncbi:MAG: type II and III secretion system protein [Planctomycetota bacterium]
MTAKACRSAPLLSICTTLLLAGCGSTREGSSRGEHEDVQRELMQTLLEADLVTPTAEFDEDAYYEELARLYSTQVEQDPDAGATPEGDRQGEGESDAGFEHEPELNPYQEFGKRIVWYKESGFVMKPFSFPLGQGLKAQRLLVDHGFFHVWGDPVNNEDFPDPDQAQPPDSIVAHLIEGYDAEAYSPPRGPGLVPPAAVALSDWLLVKARPEVLRKVRSFLHAFLVDVRQIEIEAKIVEVVTSNTFDYGIRPIDDSTPIFGLPNPGTLVNSLDFSFPNTTDSAEAVFGLSAVFDGVQFNALLELVAEEEHVSIISRPKVAVREGARAEIVNITQVAFFTLTQINANGNITSQLTFRDTGVQMYVVPRVIGRDTVILNIDVEVSQQTGTSVTFVQGDGDNTSVIAIPSFATRRATTTVRLRPGQAVILGGLITERTLERESKIPILGDIPLLGYLFKSSFQEREQTNVLFFIRPRILQGIDLNTDF